MNLTLNDGGPAFPRPLSLHKPSELRSKELGDWFSEPQSGMSLRDYFAGQALAGWLSSFGPEHKHPVLWPDAGQGVAQLSYMLADAMLAARARSSSEPEPDAPRGAPFDEQLP